MAEFINGVQVPFVPIVPKEKTSHPLENKSGIGFDDIFQKELEKLKFSSHAEKRLESRNIELDQVQLEKLNEAVFKAKAKGSKDSLVMMNNTAFIVNIPNRTVVTAVPVSAENDENIFTNIDSVVFAQ